MPPDLRQTLSLFTLVLGAQLVPLALVSGEIAPAVWVVTFGLATGVSLVWHLAARQKRSRSPAKAANDDEPCDADGLAAVHPQLRYRLLAVRQQRITNHTRRLQQQIDRLQAIYQHSHDAILLFEPKDGRLVDCNDRACQLFGLSATVLKSMHLPELHDEDTAYLRGLVDDVMHQAGGRSLRLSYRAGDGRIVPAEVSISHIALNDDNLLLCIARDISERENSARKIEHLAYHDILTGLPNRMLLTDRVNRALARARRTGQVGALLFLDLDKFKRINDSLGHSIGDELLKQLATRLLNTLREEDTVARLGGDEFVMLLEGLGRDQVDAVTKAREIADKVRGIFADEYRLDGHELYVTASIGIVTFPQDGDSVDTLLRHADTAMYHAKGDGRDGARVFDRRMDDAALSRLRFEDELRQGLRDNQFELYFQPVLKIRDGSVLGAETLIRWHHPSMGLITPSDFLPYIENSALMLKLDDWALGEACRLLADTQDDPALKAPQHLAVNISYQQFHQPDFVARVRNTIDDSGADPNRLQFEITETVLIKAVEDSVDRINALKQLGISFAIDNFGTGYSALADLRQLPIDTLKIDRTFVRDIASDPNDAAIVKAVLSMAHHIGLKVIAEGVETRAQLQFLRKAECSYYQGYLARPPIPHAQFRAELAIDLDDPKTLILPPTTSADGNRPVA